MMFILDGIIGIFLWPARLLTCLLGDVIGLILGLTSDGLTVTMEDILFNQVDNKVPILNVNFFDKVNASSTGAEAVNAIRDNISVWYTALRNLSIVLIAIIVIYVGLRMALATIAADQAKYKTMLIDWLKSLALLLVLHVLILLIITINDTLVEALYSAISGDNGAELANLSGELHSHGVSVAESFSIGVGCAIGYLVLQILTFLFFITYVKRMVHIAFLITIAPLVTITYSIDKMKDGRSQAFDTWFKQFWTSVLIQPFQCVAYLVLGSTAVKVMVPNGSSFDPSASLATMLVGIMMLGFILSAENVVRKIFGVEPNGIGRAAENMAMLTALSGVGKKAVSFGGKALKNSSAGKKVASKLKNGRMAQYLGNHPVARERLLGAGKFAVKTNALATGIFTGAAKGASTEKFGDGFLFALTGMEAANEFNKTNIDAASNEHKLARMFNDYCYYDETKTAAIAADDCRKMLEGEGDFAEDKLKEKVANAPDEEARKKAQAALDLCRQLQKSRDPSIKDKDKRNDAVLDTVKKIAKGEIGEYAGNPATKVIGAVTPQYVLGREVKNGTQQNQPNPPQPDNNNGPNPPPDDDQDRPGIGDGGQPHFENENTNSGLSEDLERKITARLDELKQLQDRYKADIDQMTKEVDRIGDDQQRRIEEIKRNIDNIQNEMDALNEPSKFKAQFKEINDNIERTMSEGQSGSTRNLEELRKLQESRTEAGQNYEAAVQRVKQLISANTDNNT